MASGHVPETLSPAQEAFEKYRRRVGLFLGPSLFALCLFSPWVKEDAKQNAILAVMLWVLAWWVTEPVPLAVTAFLGPALAVVLGVDTAAALFAPFADPVIFLFLGSFILAQGIVEAGLDRRAALLVLSLPWVRASHRRLLWACGALVAALSMWLSNTATAAMMFPLALALGKATSETKASPFLKALLLTTAYAASIGGLATPVGTPPNLIALGQLATLAKVKVSFLQWMGIGLPLTAVMLGFALWLLGRPEGRKPRQESSLAFHQLENPGPMSRREKNVLVAFSLAVVLWLAPSLLSLALTPQHLVARRFAQAFPEGVVALLAASLLFLLPGENRRPTLTWREASQLDWGTLLLFGGGLSLGTQMFQSGLAAKVGHFLVASTGASSPLALAYLFALLAILLTETISNTAAATVTCPLAIAAAQAAGVSPAPPAIAAAVAASLAFMLPVSTPPNAIVYGSGYLRVTDLLTKGSLLDLFGLLVIPPLVLALCHLWGLGG
jgi:sodium-dependent dicarboxylate transporter 2/3/5